MKKPQKIFIIQIVIAAVIFVASSFILLNIFHKDPKSKSYESVNEGVKEMSSSSTKLTNTLIATNDLTYDPTSGKLLDKVLKNLKYTEKPKLLIIGSSQMRAVQGEKVSGYVHMVSQKISRFLDGEIQTYNLSIGGMSTAEKLILTKKGTEIITPNRILIAATPWDALVDKVRPEVKAIQNKTYIYKKNASYEEKEVEVSSESEVFPININEKITKTIDGITEKNLVIYKKRAAIKKWLNAKIVNTLLEIKEDLSEETTTTAENTTPDYWRTLNQKLDNTTGWDLTVAKTGTHSLKIVNEKATSAKWLGDKIVLEKPTDTFEFEGWSKAENVASSTKLYCLDFQVFFEDGTTKWYYKGLEFKKGTHDWQQVKRRVQFDKKVSAIKPHILFYGATGTAWFDDVIAKPVYKGADIENMLPNPSFETELKERPHVSYTYNDAEWKRIEENMFSIIDFLAEQKTKEQNVLLLTPFWNNGEKTAYPQKDKYKVLVNNVQQYCKEKQIILLDASYILSTENFGVYKNGSVRGKIDVLHFNADAHEKLAKYIIKELNL